MRHLDAADHFDDGRIVMREKAALARVERGDALFLLVGEPEVEHIDILLDAFPVHRLRNADDAAVEQVAKRHLSGGLAVRKTDLIEHRVLEKVVAALGERAPALRLHAVLLHHLDVVEALAERVDLDLIDVRNDFCVHGQISEAVGHEVCHADRADAPGFAEFLHGAPAAVVVAERLMDQVEVKIIKAEPLQGLLESALAALVAGVADPDLRRDEKLLAGHAALFDGAANGFFVAVDRCRVDKAVAGGERIEHRLLAFGGIRDLIDAEAEKGHPDAVRKLCVFHLESPLYQGAAKPGLQRSFDADHFMRRASSGIAL